MDHHLPRGRRALHLQALLECTGHGLGTFAREEGQDATLELGTQLGVTTFPCFFPFFFGCFSDGKSGDFLVGFLVVFGFFGEVLPMFLKGFTRCSMLFGGFWVLLGVMTCTMLRAAEQGDFGCKKVTLKNERNGQVQILLVKNGKGKASKSTISKIFAFQKRNQSKTPLKNRRSFRFL